MKDILEKRLRELRETVRHSPKKRKAPQYQCPLCQDRGLILRNGEAVICECVRKKNLEQQVRHARLGGEYRHKTFDDFKLEYYSEQVMERMRSASYRRSAAQCLSAARGFVERIQAGESTKGMYLFGGVGSGKTLLASCIANALLTEDVRLLFISIPDFLDEIKDTFNPNGKNELDLMNRVRRIPVLIMDDLGAHTYTDWTAGRIYNIINYRASNNLPTVITSNLSVQELEHAIDARTASRILQLCELYRLDTNEDIRLQVYREKRKRV